jgi:carbamate kinase
VSNRGGKPPLVVVALGGNAIQDPDGDAAVAADFARTRETARSLVRLALEAPCRLVVTHGNGPQVGNHLLRSELAHEAGHLPALPLDVCVADTQGGMGYMLQQCLGDAFHEQGVPVSVVSIVTQVVVDAGDPAFRTPSKPVGSMIHELVKVESLRKQGWDLVEDKARDGWRRVVASPDPKEIVEAGAIQVMVEEGIVVIAVGGGGIPVTHDEEGTLTGIAAVVDKDLASSLLATDLRADGFVVLTDVSKVMLGYGTEDERAIDEMTVSEARRYLELGEFGAGSMGPKVEAICRFVEATGDRGVIASMKEATSALGEGVGTQVVPDVT